MRAAEQLNDVAENPANPLNRFGAPAALQTALGVRTVRDLVVYPPFRAASEILNQVFFPDRRRGFHCMNFAVDSHDPYSVVVGSALGLMGAEPKNKDDFLQHIDWLVDYRKNKPAPKYPHPIDAARTAHGKSVFDANCAVCRASARTVIPLTEFGTDPARIATWSKQAAIEAKLVATILSSDSHFLLHRRSKNIQARPSRGTGCRLAWERCRGPHPIRIPITLVEMICSFR